MNPESIYNRKILPDVLDYCEAFFNELLEQAYCHHLQITSANLQHPTHGKAQLNAQVKESFNQFSEWLSRCLTAPLTQITDLSQREIYPSIFKRIEHLTHYLNLATDSGLATHNNPLSHHRIIDTLENLFIANCVESYGILIDEIDTQLALRVDDFYLRLNAICSSHLLISTRREQRPPAKPNTCLDTQTHNSGPGYQASSLSDSEETIEHIKTFFDAELSSLQIGPKLNAVCKKLYLPVINIALYNPSEFLYAESPEHPVKSLLKYLQAIGQYHHHNDMTSHHALTAAIKILKKFNPSSTEGITDIHYTLAALKPLADKCFLSPKVRAPASLSVDSKPAEVSLQASPANEINLATNAQEVHNNDAAQSQKKNATQGTIVCATEGATQSTTKSRFDVMLAEGNWFDYVQHDRLVRCKLAGIVKQIDRYVFISKQGQKVLDIKYGELEELLISEQLVPRYDISFSNTLEGVLTTIKNTSSREIERDFH
jgi:hypothetical protein